MTRIAIFDSQITGISGDMILSSLIDAGANKNKVINAINACQDFLKGSKITATSFLKTTLNGISATIFQFEYKDTIHNRKGMDMYRSLASCCNAVDLEQRSKTFVLESMKTLIEAEAAVHGEEFGSVRLHEASSVDTFADLIGCATALQDLRLFGSRIFSTKIAIGSGTLSFSHGIVPNPSNAILEIFKNRPFTLVGGQGHGELTTPTGAAMLVNLTSESINHYPDFTPERTGYGAGRQKFDHVANILRLVIGKSSLFNETNTDNVFVIETNVDDISGEIVGNLIEELVQLKLKDVAVIPVLSKKNRPAYLIRVISDHTQLSSVLDMLFKESGTGGIRVHEMQRYVIPRSGITISLDIHGSHFKVRAKITKDSTGKIITTKPEFEDVKVIASSIGIPLKTAMELANAAITQKVKRDWN